MPRIELPIATISEKASLNNIHSSINQMTDELYVGVLMATVASYSQLVSAGDWTAAFSNAAKNAESGPIASDQSVTGISRASICDVYVPPGEYLLSSLVDTGGRDVRWILAPGAIITGYKDYLPGTIIRNGQKVSKADGYGTGDCAVGFSVFANLTDPDKMAGIAGFQTPADVGGYPSRDSCGIAIQSVSPALVATKTDCSFTSTRVSFSSALTPTQVLKLRVGMVIDTEFITSTTVKWTGFITDWDENGGWIDVGEGWYQSMGDGNPGTPSGITTIYINPVNTVMGGISYATLDTGCHANRIIGHEISVVNNKGETSNYGPAAPTHGPDEDIVILGYHARPFGTYDKGTAAYNAAGDWFYGLQVQNSDYGLRYCKSGGTALLADNDPGLIAEARKADGTTSFRLSHTYAYFGTGTVDTQCHLNFKSSANGNNWDTRLLCSGGTTSDGGGTASLIATIINLQAGTTVAHGNILPNTDYGSSLGSSTKRLSAVYSSTVRPGGGGVIWTAGTGSPEGVVTAIAGSLYTNSAGGAGTTLYIKESGSGNTGWVAK